MNDFKTVFGSSVLLVLFIILISYLCIPQYEFYLDEYNHIKARSNKITGKFEYKDYHGYWEEDK